MTNRSQIHYNAPRILCKLKKGRDRFPPSVAIFGRYDKIITEKAEAKSRI
jgi:hypothetical protein